MAEYGDRKPRVNFKWLLSGRRVARALEGQTHGTRSHHTLKRAASQMRDSPEYAILTPYKMSSYMMQARRAPQSVRCNVLPASGEVGQGGMHFNVI